MVIKSLNLYAPVIRDMGLMANILLSKAIDLRAAREIAVLREVDRELVELLRRKAGFNPNQPRVPAGNHDGGRWTNDMSVIGNVEYDYNISKAVKKLNENADKLKLEQIQNGQINRFGTGLCARYVRQAIQAGGVPLTNHPKYAKQYDPYLITQWFEVVPLDGYVPMTGDIAVIQPYKGGNPAGHIQMYNGYQWVSDFKQHDFWPGSGYRTEQPAYSIFRR